ncbi:MAG TPA: aldehyde ferredoxin oxidoreductase C-terminal domain-containing protein [Burkholderiales bacterium]|nr:aldehyde ferredoxin oxidoreductase C-terminal domain-containing protein [Burkholderiales bacterium]
MSQIRPGAGYCGWVGRLLRVDLDSMSWRAEALDPYLDFIGGRGVSDWIVFEESAPGTAPLDPAGVVAIGAGPLVGTLAPAAARTNISARNIATGGIATSSVGGHFGAELKFAGFDEIVLRGRAPHPVYLAIRDGAVELRDARALWGRSTWDTEDAIRRELGDERVRVACIGPAGENACVQACVIVDRGRAAGWGAGAILGAKNLKAIAVRGTRPVRLADPRGFWDYNQSLLKRVERSRASGVLRRNGTHGAYGVGGPEGKTPQGVRNQQDEYWPADKGQNLREIVYREKWEIGRTACTACPTSCTHMYHLPGGRHGPLTVEGIHTNTVRALGSNLDIVDAEAVLKGQALINQLGLNVDAVGSAIAWAYEAYERGLLTSADTDGLELTWGNADAMLELLRRIAARRGIGDLLAHGVAEAARRLGRGSEDFAMHAKGQGLNEQTVRSHKGWALGIFTSTRGGGHLNGATLVERLGMDPKKAQEVFGNAEVARPESYEGKGAVTAWFEGFKSIVDSVGLCYYTTYWIDLELIGLDEIAVLMEKAAGVQTDPGELARIGRRIQNVEKAFNTLHAGFTRRDDMPPARFFETAISSGPYAGARLDAQRYAGMLDDYYAAHGWDRESGLQTARCLDELGLRAIRARLAAAGRLPPDRSA